MVTACRLLVARAAMRMLGAGGKEAALGRQ
jgi:hypothetical protein